MQHSGSDLRTSGVPQIDTHKCRERVGRFTLLLQFVRDNAAEGRNFPNDRRVKGTARLRVVHAGEVNQRVFPQRANQRRFWRPFLILREEGFGDHEIRIDLLEVQILTGERIGPIGWSEIPSLHMTNRTAILDKNHVARSASRRDLLTLRLHIPRPRRWIRYNGADTEAE